MVTPTQGLRRLRTAEAVGELRALCRRYGVVLLTVFGSVARAEPEPRDLDVAVLARRDAAFDLFGLVTELIDLAGLEQLDVVDLGAAGPLLRERALVGALILYEDEVSRAGVLAGEFAASFRPSARLRNALVHDYPDLDHEKVAAAVPMAIGLYGEYVRQVARWLRDVPADQPGG